MKFQHIQLKTHSDARGDLTPVELKEMIPFEVKRVYFLTNTRGKRGGHAHMKEQEFFICVKGSFSAKIHDGEKWHTFKMDGGRDALYNDAMVWHEFDDFSDDAVLLAISSTNYEGNKGYIMDFDQFLT